ncbi:unnamed protein product, partial [Didymodactylos carnosus]
KSTKEINRRIGLGAARFQQLQGSVWDQTSIGLKTKLKAFAWKTEACLVSKKETTDADKYGSDTSSASVPASVSDITCSLVSTGSAALCLLCTNVFNRDVRFWNGNDGSACNKSTYLKLFRTAIDWVEYYFRVKHYSDEDGNAITSTCENLSAANSDL